MKSIFQKRHLLAPLLLFSIFTGAQSINKGFDPPKGSRIVLLGNTFADRMRHYNYFEVLLQKRFSDRNLTLRNMGWSADEVGLQPRPLNFPGFGDKTTRLTSGNGEVIFKGFTHEGEPITMPVALNLKGLNQDLTEQKADIIFLCFGMNEAFKGPEGLPRFEKDLNAFIQNLLNNKYNGRSAPELVLVSPIAHEKLDRYFPDPAKHNANLSLYSKTMQRVAAAKGLFYIDLFTPSQKAYQSDKPLTINGIHLTEKGSQLAAEWMAASLGFGSKNDFKSEHLKNLRAVVKMKDDHFFYRWRAVNGEYIYGRRREPFGVIAFPPELKKINQMTAALDSVIWDLGKKNDPKSYRKAIDIVDRRGKPVDPELEPAIPMTGRQGEAARAAAAQAAAAQAAAAHTHHDKMWPATTEKFTLPKGYNINLFASEKDFPIEKPVAMNFDAKGRLWVATMPTYPQYFPGIPVHDRIVILEDTDHDGKADKHTVFADDLYLPLGFEFGNGGVYVSQEPDILFLKDTDGDGRADLREVILTGFGSEDSHHATHAFTFGQDGALYFNEGTFLNSQVETPYGPVRSYAGTTWRYEPRTHRLDDYISYPYYNPWGSVFDKWGRHYVGDASDGSNYWAPPMTGKVIYPDKHPRLHMFPETRVRPTAGIEIVSSRNFPAAVQGDFLVNNNIGFQGTKQHRIVQNGSGPTGKEVEALLQSSDPNYRPIDLEFGPDGALYIVDWYNPLISHGENPPRDPARDKSHGRVWRITYEEKPVLKTTDVSDQNIPQLLENLKAYEDRFRYRSRAQLREKKEQEVLPEVAKWVSKLDKANADFELHLLEALWLYQDFDVVNEALLQQLLNAKEPKARTAATKVLRFWKDKIPDALTLLRERVDDSSPEVRTEAIVALSFFQEQKAAEAALDIFNHPTDYYLDYAIRETFRQLKPVWLVSLREEKVSDKAATYLLTLLSSNELTGLPKTKSVLNEMLKRQDLPIGQRRGALNELAQLNNASRIEVSVNALKNNEKNMAARQQISELLLNLPTEDLRKGQGAFEKIIQTDTSQFLKANAFAALITAGQQESILEKLISANKSAYLAGISMLTDQQIKASFFNKIKTLASETPDLSYPLLMDITIRNEARSEPTLTFISSLKTLPESIQNSETFARAVNAMKKMLPQTKPAERRQIADMLQQMGTIELTLTAVQAKMAFDKTMLTAPAGRKISLIFNNPDVMPHNVVIVKPGTEEKVGEAADAMATLKDGFEKHFVPKTDDVLFATPLVNSAATYRLDFTAPKQPGDYPFICSFPGHWRVMRGVMRILND